MSTSPNKRRALAPLNSNALPSPKPITSLKSTDNSYVGSPLRKRAVEAATVAAMEPSPKRLCASLQDQKSPSRDTSPDEEDSSLFDNDASWTSVTTPGTSPAHRTMTREQAREKAEILRLKLGLASYKVRTNQINATLSELETKDLPRRNEEEEGEEEEEKQELPTLRRVDAQATPKRQVALRDEERLTSSALRGGAASGLLSLARGALGGE